MNKITLKEFFESDEKLAIHCDTRAKLNKLLEALYDNEIQSTDEWNEYKQNICYSNRLTFFYSSLDYYSRKGYTIYEFEDIIFDEDVEQVSLQPASIYINNVKILDGKKRLTEKTEKGYQIKFDGIHTQAQIVQMIIDVVGQLEDSLEEIKNDN